MGAQFHTVGTTLTTKNDALNVDVRLKVLAVLIVVYVTHPLIVALYAEIVVAFLCHAEISETYLISLLWLDVVSTQSVAIHRH